MHLPGEAKEALRRADDLVHQATDLDIRDVLTKALESHLSAEVLGSDFQKILTEAADRYEKTWSEQLRAQSPDLRDLRAFSAASLGGSQISSA